MQNFPAETTTRLNDRAYHAHVQKNGALVHGEYTEIANHVGVDVKTVSNTAIRLGYGQLKSNGIDNSGISRIDPTPQRQQNIIEQIRQEHEERFWKEQEIEELKEEIKTEHKSTLNKVNDNIEWAAWGIDSAVSSYHSMKDRIDRAELSSRNDYPTE